MKYNENKINLLDLSKGLITVIASHFFPREHNHSLMSQVARLEGCQFPWSLLCTSEENLLCDFNCLARGAKIVALILHDRHLTCHCWEVFFHPALSFKSYNPNRQNQRERKKNKQKSFSEFYHRISCSGGCQGVEGALKRRAKVPKQWWLWHFRLLFIIHVL